ncbi:MAG: hypothetical protein P4L73_09845 [Caulobacteraceae bacterium]|nr:hypothetical protein [Caulobacteraceae bacterium]
MATNPLLTLIMGRRATRPAPVADLAGPEQAQIERAFQEDGERLEHIASIINDVADDLGRIEALRLSLENLKGPIRSEFRARLKENARAASLSAQLFTALARLADSEAEHKAAARQLEETLHKAGRLEEVVEQLTAARLAAETEVLELRPALAQSASELDEMGRELAQQREDHAVLEIANTALKSQVENLVRAQGDLKGRADQLHEDLVLANDQLAGARKRYEETRADAVRFERIADDLTFALAAERDRVAALEAQLAAARAESGRTIAALQATEDQRRAELAELKDRLEDAQSRCARLEAVRETSVVELQALTAERADLLRIVAARDVDVGQLKKRLESHETAKEEARRQCVDLEMARSAAVLRADVLAKEVTNLEARLARTDLAVEQKSGELAALQASREQLKVRLLHDNQELQGVVAQQKSEISMLRGALGATKRSKARGIEAGEEAS